MQTVPLEVYSDTEAFPREHHPLEKAPEDQPP